MDISLDKNVDTTDAVQLDLSVLVLSPVAHPRHIGASSIVLLVAYRISGVSAHEGIGGAEERIPSASTTSLSSFAESLRPLGDSIQEL